MKPFEVESASLPLYGPGPPWAAADVASGARCASLPPAAWRREAVLVLDEARRVVEWNAAATMMFGLHRDDALGREVGSILLREERHADLRRRWENLLTAAISDREWTFEAFTILARGEEVPISGRVTRVGMTHHHAADCLLVNGKDVRALTADDLDLVPCGVCA